MEGEKDVELGLRKWVDGDRPARRAHERAGRQTGTQSGRQTAHLNLQKDSLTRKARPRRMSPRMFGVPASSLSS